MGIALGVKNSKATNAADLKKDFDQICEAIRQRAPPPSTYSGRSAA